MPLKKTGVRLVAENEQGFLGALNKANKSVKDLGTTAATTGNVGLIALSAGIAAVVFVVTKALQLITNLISKIFELGKTSIILAARWEELRQIAQMLGQRAGLTAGEVDELADSIEEQGIRADVASKLIAQLARYNLDLTKATELATVAQDAATFSGQDSSETLENLLYGVITYNKRVLRTQGILVDVKGSFVTYAKSIDKSVESLTEADKVQATFNAVLEAGIPIAGAYEISMQNAGKQFRSLIGRELPELSAAFGTFFQPAFLAAVKAARQFVSGLKDMISEGGRLYPLMIKIGAIASFVADGLARLAGVGLEAGTSFIENFANKMAEAAEKALRWGVDIAVSLGDGLIKGAASAIIAAMNYISNLIAYWLESFSPPRVAPDIVKWGKKTMEEYLRGWTLADFSFFNKITGFISGYIRSLPGLIGDKAVNIIPRILGSRNAVESAINMMQRTGEVTESTINKIIKSIGGATKAFRNYIRAYFLAEAATYRVAQAQEALTKASEKVKAIQEDINEIMTKYDDRLRDLNKQLSRQGQILDENQRLAKIQKALATGLLTDEERARLLAEKQDIGTRQEIRLLEDQRDAELEIADTKLNAALEEQKAIEARLVLLEKQQDSAKEFLEVQEAIIQAQIEQNSLLKSQAQLLKRLADAAKKAGAGGEEDPDAPFGGLGGAFEKAQNRIYAAIEEMKQRIIDKMGEIFAPIRDKWDTEWKPIFDDLVAKWKTLETNVNEIWSNLFGESGTVITVFKSAGNTIKKIWEDTIWPAMQNVHGWMKTELSPYLEGLVEFISAVWRYAIDNISDAWKNLLDVALKPLKEYLSSTLGPYIEGTFVGKILQGLVDIITKIWEGLKTAIWYFSELGDKLKRLANIINNLPRLGDYIGRSPSPLEKGLAGINKTMRELSQIELPKLAIGLGSAQHASPVSNQSTQYITNNNSTNVSVDPTYTQVQSPTSIYYDVMAALQATRL
jgi:hypothetical protein